MTNGVTRRLWRPAVAGLLPAMLWLGASRVEAQTSPAPEASATPTLAETIRVDAARLVEAPSGQSPAKKQRDSVLNGVLIGAGIGAVVGLIPDYYDDCGECHDPLYGSIVFGAGIGLLIDLLHNPSPKPSPSKQSDLRLGLQVRGRAVSIAGRLAWR
jgi:hypothetical protein